MHRFVPLRAPVPLNENIIIIDVCLHRAFAITRPAGEIGGKGERSGVMREGFLFSCEKLSLKILKRQAVNVCTYV